MTGELKNSSLNRFHILSSFLREKPYAFSLTADKSRRVQNREFFERQVIEATTYGGNFGLKNNFIPVEFSFNNNSRTVDRAFRPSQKFYDNELSLSLRNESRAFGETRFNFTQDRYSRTESGTPDQKGTSRDLNLSNYRYLFDDRKLLSSFLHFYKLTGTSDSDLLNLSEKLNIEHTDRLSTSYGYDFSDKSSSGSETKDNRISANLRHRLYESLTSLFDIYYFTSDATTFSQDSWGLSLDEDYVKRLGRIGRLSAGVGLSYSEEERRAPANVILVIDESITLITGVTTFLEKPRVDTATVIVTDSAGTTTYTLDVDYQLTAVGDRTQIQRITTGSISDGDTVLVDYEAKDSPSFKFNTLGEDYRFRIDFLDNLLGLFCRLTKETHPKVSGEENIILQTLTDTLFGMDISYRNLNVKFESEDYDSNLSPYKQLRLTESLLFNPTARSALTFQSSQSKIRLIDSRQTQRFFDFISRYTIRLGQNARFNAEAGFRWQEGADIDLSEFTARSGFEFRMGKLFVTTEYDFEKQRYLGDSLVNHFFSTEIRRTF